MVIAKERGVGGVMVRGGREDSSVMSRWENGWVCVVLGNCEDERARWTFVYAIALEIGEGIVRTAASLVRRDGGRFSFGSLDVA